MNLVFPIVLPYIAMFQKIQLILMTWADSNFFNWDQMVKIKVTPNHYILMNIVLSF